MMLASTVQFSRYGRSRRAPPRPRRAEPVRGTENARSLRTQQRARPGRRRRHPSVREDVLAGLSSELTEYPVLHSELPSRDVRPRHGSGRDLRRGRARCSLERR